MSSGRLPTALKVGFSLWVAAWAPAYVVLLGAQNFFWLCNLAHFLILAGLWLENRLLLSMQWLAIALVGAVWGLDVIGAALTGIHPIGGTEYMFNPDYPLAAKLLSFYHLGLPLVAGFAVRRLGYQPRALLWQSALTWAVLPATWALTDTWRNINWVHGPFGSEQDLLAPGIYLLVLALAWPVAVYLPVHFATRGWPLRWQHQAPAS